LRRSLATLATSLFQATAAFLWALRRRFNSISATCWETSSAVRRALRLDACLATAGVGCVFVVLWTGKMLGSVEAHASWNYWSAQVGCKGVGRWSTWAVPSGFQVNVIVKAWQACHGPVLMRIQWLKPWTRCRGGRWTAAGELVSLAVNVLSCCDMLYSPWRGSSIDESK
jgi:hypothetical protein